MASEITLQASLRFAKGGTDITAAFAQSHLAKFARRYLDWQKPETRPDDGVPFLRERSR